MIRPPWKILEESGLRPRKSLGQNFLIDPSTASMIIRNSGLSSDETVLEIGPGLGALTVQLSQKAERVYAVEKDASLARILEKELLRLGIENVAVVHSDIFDVDPRELCSRQTKPLKVFGNLPYYISSPLLFYLTGYREHVEQADLMLQRELARRIVAESGTKVYGRLSVMLQYYADIRRSATVDAHLFWPHPRVDSEVLQFRFKKEPFPALESKAVFAEVVKAAFGKRRKTLQNALLASRLAVEKERLAAAFSQCGIDPQSRAETLTVRQFADLANALCF